MWVMYNNNYTCCEIGKKVENVSIKSRHSIAKAESVKSAKTPN
jgi:hypothetical protein